MVKTDKNSIILSILIMIQPILDICSYFAVEAGITTVTTMLRFAIFGAVMLYAFALSNRKKVYFIFAGIVGLYWIIHVLICARDGYSFVSDTNNLLRTLHMPALTIAFITLFKHANRYPENIGKCFSINYVIIAASIILSFIVNKPVYTYDRWIDGIWAPVGIKGWFYTGNSQSCIIAVMSLLALYDAYRKKNNLYFVGVMALSFVMLFFFGTRVTYISIFLVALSFLVLILWNREKRIVVPIALVLAIAVAIVGYPYSPNHEIRSSVNNSQMAWEEFIEENTPTQPTISEDPTQPITNTEKPEPPQNQTILGSNIEVLSARFGHDKVLALYGNDVSALELMDNRQAKVNFGKLLMAENDIWIRLFGCEYQDFDYNGGTYDPESDFSALYFFHGYVGIALYIGFVIYFALLLLKDILMSLKKLPAEKVLVALSLVLAFGVAQLSANVLRRPNVSIYISLLLAYAYYICKKRKEQPS